MLRTFGVPVSTVKRRRTSAAHRAGCGWDEHEGLREKYVYTGSWWSDYCWLTTRRRLFNRAQIKKSRSRVYVMVSKARTAHRKPRLPPVCLSRDVRGRSWARPRLAVAYSKIWSSLIDGDALRQTWSSLYSKFEGSNRSCADFYGRFILIEKYCVLCWFVR